MREVTKRALPAVLVIFGASGDLTSQKLVSALHALGCEGLLPPQSRMVGLARTPLTNEASRDEFPQSVSAYAHLRPGVGELWPRWAEQHTYLATEYDDAETDERRAQRLTQLDSEAITKGNHLFCPDTTTVQVCCAICFRTTGFLRCRYHPERKGESALSHSSHPR